MPYVVSLTLNAYQVTVPPFFCRQGASLLQERGEFFALARLGLEQCQ
ncbi:hypothetical protein [Rhodococcus sp. IEGM 1305]|nr:hypothetical protein [Rhodococcus sp. IEGM 1305]MDI9947759.1 hypothetical protein [Rhodococcus sp. IEGM 1305]